MSFTRKTLTVLAFMIVAMIVIPAGAAFADAGANASCVGHEASAISPAGTSDELPGGMPQLISFLKEAFPGVSTGQIVGQIAKIHAGSHEACDEALE